MSRVRSDSDDSSGSSPILGVRKRARRMFQFSSDDDDEEEENVVLTNKVGTLDSKKPGHGIEGDSDSDGSNATEVMGDGGLRKEEDSSLFEDDDDDKVQPSLKTYKSVWSTNDSDDGNDELLSISSWDDKKEQDYDSDETSFEPIPPSPPPIRKTDEMKRDDNRPGTSASFMNQKKKETAYNTDDDFLSDTDSTSSTSNNPSFKPGSNSFSDESSDDDDFKKPRKSRSPLRPQNRNNLPQSNSKASKPDLHADSEDSESEDFVIPQSRRNRSLNQEWLDLADYDMMGTNSPPVYNPSSVLSEDWHGDVQRTVTMLDKTIGGMPMPTDEDCEDIKLPPGLVELYPHQTYALRWMSWRERQFPGGGILADEMGLGKTIEVIALIMKSRWDAQKAGNENLAGSRESGRLLPSRTTLIVSPLGCIPQWVREMKTKGKDLNVYTYHGTKKTTSAIELAKYDVVITTYQTIGLEIPKPPPEGDPPKRCHSPLKRLYWLRIVLDEAHQIRNPKTLAAQAICQLEARHRWAVTGTPIHNRPEDFFSMCAFLRLTPFDERNVWDFWIGLKQIKRRGGAEQRLHVLGKALILRRTKDEVGAADDGQGKVKKIPPKNVEIVQVQLSEEERQVYDMLMDYAQSILQRFLNQREQREHGVQLGGLVYAADRVQERREEFPQDIKFSHIFALLIRLRQCAVLPHLITTMLHAEEVDGQEFDDLKPEHIVSKRNPVFDRLYKSSKFQKILDDIDELRVKAQPGEPMDKVIIVSSWTSTLDIIHEHLMNKNYTCVFITGRDDMTLRQDNMDRFNKNKWRPQVLLLSLMAGGVGLNLVGANHVFFIEPHWNPQHELQAQDRVHRFGQTKNVFIRRYVAEDTIESRIMELQDQKIELAKGLLSNTKKGRGGGITLDQMKHLFDLNRRDPIMDENE